MTKLGLKIMKKEPIRQSESYSKSCDFRIRKIGKKALYHKRIRREMNKKLKKIKEAE